MHDTPASWTSSFQPGWGDRPRAALGGHWGPPTCTGQGSAAHRGDRLPSPQDLPTQPRPPHAGFLGSVCLLDSRLGLLNSRNPLAPSQLDLHLLWPANSQGRQLGQPQLHLPLCCPAGPLPSAPAGQCPDTTATRRISVCSVGRARRRPVLHLACSGSLRSPLSAHESKAYLAVPGRLETGVLHVSISAAILRWHSRRTASTTPQLSHRGHSFLQKAQVII